MQVVLLFSPYTKKSLESKTREQKEGEMTFSVSGLCALLWEH